MDLESLRMSSLPGSVSVSAPVGLSVSPSTCYCMKESKSYQGEDSCGQIWMKIGGNQPDAFPDLSIPLRTPYSDKKTFKHTKVTPKKVSRNIF